VDPTAARRRSTDSDVSPTDVTGEDGWVDLARTRRLAVTTAVVALLVAPVVVNTDGWFPLSTYPMYSSTRGVETTFVTAQGLTGDGNQRDLTPSLIGGSDDPLLVVGELRAVLAAGRGDERCAEIASRVSSRDDYGDVTAIEVVAERHDNVARTRGDDDSLVNREVRARCEVER